MSQEMSLQSIDVELFGKVFPIFGYEEDTSFKRLKEYGTQSFDFNPDNLRRFIRSNSVCLDVGANMGLLSLVMACLAPEGKVYAFEGSPATYIALINTIRSSQLKNIETFNWIVGDGKSSGTFVDYEELRSSSHFLPTGNGKNISHAIDELRLPAVDLIKIDVEGGEMDVLDGMMATLDRCHPNVIMEFNTFAYVCYRDISPRQVLNRIFQVFPQVAFFEHRTGKVKRLTSRDMFLKNNFVNNFVDDLVCGFT